MMAFNYKEYYEANKDKISLKRKRRYRNDLDYRELQKKRFQEYRKRTYVPVDKTVFKEDGIKILAISHMAVAINRSIPTVRHYHEVGILPAISYTNDRGWRMYSEAQIADSKHAFSLFDRGITLKTLTDVGEVLAKGWR
jgi:hypothetical protein